MYCVENKRGECWKVRGDEFRLGVSGQVSLEIEYFN